MTFNLIPKYIEYSEILGITTLENRKRQYTWWIKEILKKIKPHKKELEKLVKKIKIDTFLDDFKRINELATSLASNLSVAMRFLKLMYFHDSTVLYIQLKLLLSAYHRLKKKEKEVIKRKKKEKKKKKIQLLEHKIKEIEKEIGEISKTADLIVHSLKDIKVLINKMLREGSSIKLFTLLKEDRINDRIRIESRKVKEIEIKRRKMMGSIDMAEKHDLMKFLKLLKKEIKLTTKSVIHSDQLIRKLRNKVKSIEDTISKLKKKMSETKITEKGINQTLEQITNSFNKLEETIDKYLHEMFKEALRELNMANKKEKGVAT